MGEESDIEMAWISVVLLSVMVLARPKAYEES